jgi:hypothetical protein
MVRASEGFTAMTHTIKKPFILRSMIETTAAPVLLRVAISLFAGGLSSTTLLCQMTTNLTITNQNLASGTYQAFNTVTADAGNGNDRQQWCEC